MAHRAGPAELAYLVCSTGRCSLALPAPVRPIPIECPYHPGADMTFIVRQAPPPYPQRRKA